MTGLAKWIIFLCMTLCLVASCGAVTTSCGGSGVNYNCELFSTLTPEGFSISQSSTEIPITPGTSYFGIIPCLGTSETCPAMDEDVYAFSLAQKSIVTILVDDCCIVGDRYNVYVDDELIGVTSQVACDGGVLSSGTFTIELDAGDHTLQFADTCSPCFTGSPPCYEGWLPAGFYFSYTTETVIPSPEFPSLFLPVSLIIGMLGVVLLIQRTREH